MIFPCAIAAFTAATLQLGIAASMPPFDDSRRLPVLGHLLCKTPGCVEAADYLLKAMNTTVDPCVDFFQFACGKWIHDYHPVSKAALLHYTISEKLKVELSSNEPSPSQSINNARKLYATCMDIKKIDDAKTSELYRMLIQLGSWPLLTEGRQWNERKDARADFNRIMTDIHRMYGVKQLISMAVTADLSNSTQNIIHFGEPSLSFKSRDQYLLPEYESHRTAYKKLIYEIASLMLSDFHLPIPSNLNASVENILLMEIAIANITLPLEERRNWTEQNNRFTISELYEMVPQLDWLAFVRASAPEDVMGLIGNDTIAIVRSLKYFQQLSSVLQTFSPNQLADMMLWQTIYTYSDTQATAILNIELEFNRVVMGQEELQLRHELCKEFAKNSLPLAVGAMYVRDHFSSDDKKEAMDMVSNVREAFRKIVRNLDWMDNSTKESTLEKERNIVELVGYPDFILDPTLLDKEYEGVQILSDDSFFEQIRKLVVWSQHKNMRELRARADRSEFNNPPADVNAAYGTTQNSITLSAAILQPPFFSRTYPKYVNYGAIGSVVGHEITHGFDDSGSQFDKTGNVVNWWSDDAAAKFAKRTQCMVNQYNKYTVPGTNKTANGELTLGENIADNGGVKEAYEAYRAYVQQHGEEFRLPGLHQYTPDQLFFLSFAQFYCGANTPEVNLEQTLTDEHSVASNRILGVLSNLPQFAAAFKCAAGTPYNPHAKCSVW